MIKIDLIVDRILTKRYLTDKIDIIFHGDSTETKSTNVNQRILSAFDPVRKKRESIDLSVFTFSR